MKKVLILYSGGLDSTILIMWAKQIGLSVYCLGVNYHQKHVRELEKAKVLCDRYAISYLQIDIPLNTHSKLTDGAQKKYENVSEWYVPSRNLLFVALAASHAESLGIDRIWLGANYDDRLNLFPDCYQEWIVKTNELLKINASYPITLEAPLLGFTKEHIQMWASYLGIKNEEVHSGYNE